MLWAVHAVAGRCRRCRAASHLLTNSHLPGVHVNELGEILRSARQKKNLSLSQVTRATRIKQSYLEALEDGEYSVLPGPAYVTGFLRNYALYLGLHPDDLIQEYYAVQAPPQPRVKAAT